MLYRKIAVALLIATALGGRAQAENPVLMRALEDELERSMQTLRLEELERPYFIAYRVTEGKNQEASATFGSLLTSGRNHSRTLQVEVRVGDYSLDNTHFQSFSYGRSGVVWMYGGRVPLPLEDDYGELRRQIWLATDGVYKKALEDLAKKKAVLQNKTRTEIIDDFSREDPATVEDWGEAVEVEQAWMEDLVKRLSALFREAPAVIEAVRKLPQPPDLLMCDGQGLAHPRGLGLACHVGLWLDVPTIGVAKSRLCGAARRPGVNRGCRTRLVLDGKVVGWVLRTRTGVKPLYVSPGHRVSLDDAARRTLGASRGFRLPQPTRLADQYVSRMKKL